MRKMKRMQVAMQAKWQVLAENEGDLIYKQYQRYKIYHALHYSNYKDEAF